MSRQLDQRMIAGGEDRDATPSQAAGDRQAAMRAAENERAAVVAKPTVEVARLWQGADVHGLRRITAGGRPFPS